MAEQNEVRGEAATKVEIPETDWAALSGDDPVDEDFVDEVDADSGEEAEGGDQSGEDEEGQEEEVLKEEDSVEGEEPPTESLEEEQPSGEAVPPPDMTKLRQAEVERLTGVYSLSDEDARMMTVEPEKVLPKRMAEMHANIVESVVAVLGAQLPGVVEALTQQKVQRASTEDAFFKKFPALKKPEFRQTVENSLRAARANDPKASVDEVLTQAGIMASLKHRVPLPKELLGADVPPPETSKRPKGRSFVPANPGGSAGGRGAAKGEFEKLADELFNDED